MPNLDPTQYKNVMQRKLTDSLLKVRKSGLSTDVGSGDALIPLPLQKEIVNGIISMNPFLGQMNLKNAGDISMITNRHTYVKLNRLRRPGSYSSEKATGTLSEASTSQAFVNHKVRKSRMRVWQFVEQVTRGQIDVLAFELDNQMRAVSLDMGLSLLFDNPVLKNQTSTSFGAFEHSFDTQIQQNRISKFVAGLPVTLTEDILDEMIEAAILGGADPERSAIYMSPAMANRLSKIVTPGAITYFNNLDNSQPFQANAGLFIKTYKGFPIVTNTFCGGKTAGRNDVAYAISNIAGGDFTADTWHFKVEKVQIDANNDISNLAMGRSIVNASLSQALSGVEGVRITIPTGDETTLQYRIYAAQTADTLGNHKLIAVVPGQTYDVNGDIVGSVTRTNPTSGLAYTSDANGNVISIDVLHATDEFYPVSNAIMEDQGIFGKMKQDLPFTRTSGLNSEMIMLIDHTTIRGLGDIVYLTPGGADADTGFMIADKIVPQGDYSEFLLRFYGTPVMAFDGSSSVVHGVKPY